MEKYNKNIFWNMFLFKKIKNKKAIIIFNIYTGSGKDRPRKGTPISPRYLFQQNIFKARKAPRSLPEGKITLWILILKGICVSFGKASGRLLEGSWKAPGRPRRLADAALCYCWSLQSLIFVVLPLFCCWLAAATCCL